MDLNSCRVDPGYLHKRRGVICCLLAELAQFTDDAWEQEDDFTFVTLLMKTLATINLL
jgi:hypothetical protein